MPDTTDNHDFQLWRDGEANWEHRTDFEKLDARLELRGPLSDRPSEPPDGTKFLVTSGDQRGAIFLYDADDDTWEKQPVDAESVRTPELQIGGGDPATGIDATALSDDGRIVGGNAEGLTTPLAEDLDVNGRAVTDAASIETENLYTDGRIPDVFVVQRGDEYVAFDSSGEIDRGEDGREVFQSATSDARSGDVVYVSGTYTFDSTGLTLETDLHLIGYDATVDIAEPDGSSSLNAGDLYERQTVSADVTADVSEGEYTISVDDASQFEPDDLLVLRRDTVPYVDATGMGEMSQIESIDYGSDRIVVRDSACFDYPVSDNARVSAYDPVSLTIEGFDFRGVDPEDQSTNGIFLQGGLVDTTIENCTFESFGNNCVAIRTAYNTTVTGCTFRDGEGTGGDGYGVSVGGATTNTAVRDNEFHNIRHAVGCVSPGPGVPKSVRVYDNFATGGVGGIFDAHGGTLSVTWKDNVVDCQKATYVFYSGAHRNRTIGNVVYGGGILAFDRGQDQAGSSHVIRNNEVHGDGTRCIRLRRSAPFDTVVIEHNTWYGQRDDDRNISVESDVAGTLRIVGNTITDMGRENGIGISVQGRADGAVIADNHLENMGKSGIRFEKPSRDVIVKGNVIRNFNLDGNYSPAAIRLEGVENSVIRDNELQMDAIPVGDYSFRWIHQEAEVNQPNHNLYTGNVIHGPAEDGIRFRSDGGSSVVVRNPGNTDATRTAPADPWSGTEYLDDGTNRSDGEMGYRRFEDGEWHDL